ncbi:MAG: hypothetical protein HFI37_09115 [Lachnospiraceae bacterium]|nr:hypothetical protein [Lachnospiraceae bacterium]
MSVFEKDYVMRIIHEVIRVLIKAIYGEDIDKEMYVVREETKEQGKLLKKLTDEGKIEEAENQLLDGIEQGSGWDLEDALLFYGYLNQKDDKFLEAHHFSRKEIIEGIRYAANYYGYGSMAESLLEEAEE